MATLPLRSSHISEASVLPGLGRIFGFISAAFEVFAEAQDMARDAQKRYPFVLEG